MASLSIDEQALNAQVMARLDVFARGFVSTVATEARRLAPRRTGELERGIQPDPVRRTGPWVLETGVSGLARHSAPVHEGARPHVIRAKNAAALSFYWPKVGRRVFFARVNHPGNKPNPFLRNAAHRVASADPRITIGTS